MKEINLISQDTSSYGIDFKNGTGLATLLKNISKIDGDFWICLFYYYPNSFTHEGMEVIAGEKSFAGILICRFNILIMKSWKQ